MALTDKNYKWFFVPIEVRGIPVRAEFVLISFHIDFEDILERLGERGAVGERTLKLYRIESDRREMEESVQFSPDTQPRNQ